MNKPNPDVAISSVSHSMISLMLMLFERAEVEPLGHGLPQGSLLLPAATVVIAATPCAPPAFDRAVLKAHQEESADVILVHHGFFPEVLDEVLFSVARGATLSRHRLFIDRGRRTWLVAVQGRVHYLITRDGLLGSYVAPYGSDEDRSAGLCAAAKLIAALTLGKEAA
ncbi:hypothetical protein [Sphingomicrobium arenosum]|uniref:hypothetical protein n=1 Tax=Sphingomicrobium arenosum TaxID=2233861 RepID=UPI00224066E7|nr:hypothetical protein [Sphingomicrobium arenosum]